MNEIYLTYLLVEIQKFLFDDIIHLVIFSRHSIIEIRKNFLIYTVRSEERERIKLLETFPEMSLKISLFSFKYSRFE